MRVPELLVVHVEVARLRIVHAHPGQTETNDPLQGVLLRFSLDLLLGSVLLPGLCPDLQVDHGGLVVSEGQIIQGHEASLDPIFLHLLHTVESSDPLCEFGVLFRNGCVKRDFPVSTRDYPIRPLPSSTVLQLLQYAVSLMQHPLVLQGEGVAAHLICEGLNGCVFHLYSRLIRVLLSDSTFSPDFGQPSQSAQPARTMNGLEWK